MRIRRLEACPACGAESAVQMARLGEHTRQRFLELSERKYGGLMNAWLSELEVAISKCEGCGHHWYREQPGEEDLARLYEAARPLLGVQGPPPDYSSHMLAEMRRLRRFVDRRSIAGRPTLLDYGSGFGRWARAAADAGFSVTAYEPSLVRGALAVRGDVTTIEHASALQGRTFDAINVEQVLEHTADPLAELRRILLLCRAATALRITVPNIDRPAEGRELWRDWPFDGRRMHTMAPFEHLHGFTPRSIELLARRAGFLPVPWHFLWSCDAPYAARRVMRYIAPRLGQTKVLAVPAVAGTAD